MFIHIIFVAVMLLLSACNDSSNNQSAEQEVKEESKKAPVQQTNNEKFIQEGDKEKGMLLDLSVPDDVELTTSGDFSDKERLPNLFEKEEKKKLVTLKSKLLRDENNPDYMKSLNGAEFSVEMETQ